MSVAEYYEHPFKGKVLFIPDTEENREARGFYFNQGYHHYTYECHGIYKFYGEHLAHCYVQNVMEGKERVQEIEDDISLGERFNLPIGILNIFNPRNKDLTHLLSRLDD